VNVTAKTPKKYQISFLVEMPRQRAGMKKRSNETKARTDKK